MNASPKLRSGVVVGAEVGAGVALASGYPNNALEIGDPNFHSSSGWIGGTSESIFLMGALADTVNFGFWYTHGVYSGGQWHSNGSGGGLRVEAFPFVQLAASLANLGFFGQFGIGRANLTSSRGGQEAEGTQSFIGTGAFYEWAFGHVLGGHFAGGPSLEYHATFSQPFERHALVAAARIVFYGGP